LEDASVLGCRACATSGGGCQFLGTAATAQVVAEALGLALPHSALAPSGQPVWQEIAIRSAHALLAREKAGLSTQHILTEASLRNAMTVHAAFGGSTNLLLHIPAIAHAAGLQRPMVKDWQKVNSETPRLVSVLPNGPVDHPTVRVFLAGGVPEVMLHLRDANLLNLDTLSATGEPLGDVLESWERSERRERFKAILEEQDGVRPDEIIFSARRSKALGLGSTVSFLTGNLAPDGAIVKSTAIDPAVLKADGSYLKEGPARVFNSEKAAIKAIKAGDIKEGDILVLAGVGPAGTGMEETYQITSALKHLPFGKHVALITDARFSGVSTGACIGHVGPEGLAGGPIGKVQEGDLIRISILPETCSGRVELIGTRDDALSPEAASDVLKNRPMNESLAPDPNLPADTKLWAALQGASGGTWGGCVYDTERIDELLKLALTVEASRQTG
ncbi:MAG: dihydroxy-acid dehydratase, partial [Trueperaceae bacterium]|nr:dihydroxy-acid dehydratase [Trueperaceae bacterium]